jgi:hypothetical protein
MSTQKKIILLLVVNAILFAVGLYVLELFAEKRLKATRAQFRIDAEQILFYKKYTDILNHVREPHFLFHISSDIQSTITDFLFTRAGEGGRTVLMQGDSWAEQFVTSLGSHVILERFADQNDVSFINAGIASYSPSLMEAQYVVLTRDFKIRPEVVIGLIDQTDVADELCRYRNLLAFDSEQRPIVRPFPITEKHPFSPLTYLDLIDTLDRKEPALVRLLRYKYKKDFVSIPPTKACSSYDQIVAPLKGVLAPDDRVYFVHRLQSYINTVFDSDMPPQTLLLVTHYHRGHANGEFSLNVATLVNEAIASSPHRERIKKISFVPEDYIGFDSDEIFKKGDPFSHLSNSTHRRRYSQRILNALSDELVRKQ